MQAQRKGKENKNTMTQRNDWTLIAALCCWLLAFHSCLINNEGINEWVGGTIVLIIFTALIALMIFYELLALWLIPILMLMALTARITEVWLRQDYWMNSKTAAFMFFWGLLWTANLLRFRRKHPRKDTSPLQ